MTGGGGFVGKHVAAACTTGGALEKWQFHAMPHGLDIRDAQEVRSWVEGVRPRAVLHLAAQSFVPRSFVAPQETFEINLLGTLNLLESLKKVGFTGRMIYVSSGDVYGHVPDEALPVTEARIPEPRSPYAVSKIAAEQLCLQYHRTEGLDIIIARPFNHVGPGQGRQFVLPSLAAQIVNIADERQQPVIRAGDIDTSRDFLDVRDVVAAYGAMLENGLPGATYVVASGRERRVRDLLQEMCEIAQIAVEVCQDPARIRRAEQRRMVADASLLGRQTGWTPVISLDQTLQEILMDARNRI